jgi:hypothetical protein
VGPNEEIKNLKNKNKNKNFIHSIVSPWHKASQQKNIIKKLKKEKRITKVQLELGTN